jgi:hypothetical protein
VHVRHVTAITCLLKKTFMPKNTNAKTVLEPINRFNYLLREFHCYVCKKRMPGRNFSFDVSCNKVNSKCIKCVNLKIKEKKTANYKFFCVECNQKVKLVNNNELCPNCNRKFGLSECKCGEMRFIDAECLNCDD